MNAKLSPSTRRFELDWLRVGAILSVFLYHSTRFFNTGDWHVKNFVTYRFVDTIQHVMEIWMMPLIFVVSGASVFLAMDKSGRGTRGTLQFFKDKFLRLVVPWVVVVFTHASLQVYLERITHGQFKGSYFQFLPHYFDGIYMDTGGGGNFAWAGMHMWYVVFLLLFIIAFYPLMLWLKGSGKKVYNGLAAPLALPIAFFLLTIPLAIIDLLISGTALTELNPGGWDLPYYAAFFIGGFLLVGHPRLTGALQKMRWLNLGITILMTAAAIFFNGTVRPALADIAGVLDGLTIFMASWAGILALLGFGSRHLNFSTPRLKYANEAVLPFYILHQTVLLVAGYFVRSWGIPDLAKWLIITVASFAIIMGIYELLVRRNNLLRVLFGMKVQPKAQPQEQSVSQPA